MPKLHRFTFSDFDVHDITILKTLIIFGVTK
jgi:hypothetical protein